MEIHARILMICAKVLSRLVTKWFNLSFSLGKVLLIWKRANIAPVFKSKCRKQC